jgi:hypothetical protein
MKTRAELAEVVIADLTLSAFRERFRKEPK